MTPTGCSAEPGGTKSKMPLVKVVFMMKGMLYESTRKGRFAWSGVGCYFLS